jgi:chromosome segregation ATPase
VPEVVYGRHLLLSPVEIPLPRFLVKAQRAMEEAEMGFHREWERLEAERLRLSDWERRLGDRIKTITSRHVEERAQLKQEHDDLQEQLQRVLEREAAAARREKAAARREKVVIEWELVMEERTKAALDLTNHAKAALKLIEEQRAALQEQEMGLRERGMALPEREVVLQEREAKVEELLAEWSAGIDRVVRWVDEVNPSLDALRLSPIQVVEAPPSLGTVLPVLDSAVQRLRHMESAILDRLETEGRVVARAMAEYILTCYRSHDPTIPLAPILVGPVRAMATTAQEGV